ncbi:beta-ketoacyl synthase N-terminal-like domain-containing protein [Streptomyces tendae]|uniref:beta-ketoacyl synthase N-terminal-like domain-containing protein n=1 Tax=Streptomyces tendae TaxID=1932 RepID=UPI00371E1003
MTDPERNGPAHTAGQVDRAVAVVGMSCRVPGAEDIRTFWRLLHDGVDAITDAPADRWDLDAIPNTPGRRRGGFLDGVADFDCGFFGISPREAAAIDPRQRLALALSWSALERARVEPDSLRGGSAAVFLGATERQVLPAGVVEQHVQARCHPSHAISPCPARKHEGNA